MDAAKETLRGSSSEIQALNEQLNAAKKAEKEAEKRVREVVTDEAAEAKAQKVVDKYRVEYEKAEAKASKVRAENEELSNKLVDISKGILDIPKENLKQLQKEKSAANKV